MSNDLEDFLKRAAARRQASEAAKRQSDSQQPGRPSRPQYTDARSERTIRMPDDDDVIMAEVVETQSDSRQRSGGNRPSSGTSHSQSSNEALRLREIRQRAGDIRIAEEELRERMAPRQPEAPSRANRPQKVKKELTLADVTRGGITIDDLIASLRTPHGIRQAILMREIIDRPEHRW